ncbi:MAG TPA: hypothetical protein VJT74_16030 [Pyrinomonadaceae bacterium]|nr:hypothetical protein [Pyrinomonadaceae bacterium]
MSDEAVTKPNLKTILEAVNAIGVELHQLGVELHQFRTDVDIRLDRIEGFAHQTRSELLDLRADVKELRKEFNEFRSQFKQPA